MKKLYGSSPKIGMVGNYGFTKKNINNSKLKMGGGKLQELSDKILQLHPVCHIHRIGQPC
jgi:hypothetical protein